MWLGFKPRYKLWLETEDGLIIGTGLQRILQAIASEGSIARAAVALGMSYRQAWSRINKAQKRLGVQLVRTQIGGEGGGGSVLTLEGEQLLKNYTTFQEEVQQAINNSFSKLFNS